MSQVYLNGAFLPLEEAKVSVLDRGFLFGDGIYEVIPAFHGRLLAFDRHLERLNQSLDAIRMEPVQPEGGWKALCQQLLDNNRSLGEHRAVYLQITRGTGELRTHFFPDDIKPTVFVMVMAIGGPMSDLAQEASVARLVTEQDQRWKRCHIKSISLLGHLMALDNACQRGATDCIQIDEQGRVTEAAASNVFMVRDGVIMTPPLSGNILPGVTRALVLEVAREDRRYACEEKELSLQDLRQADEIWLTSSTKEIRPVVSLDGEVVGSGQPGPVWKHIASAFCAFRDAQLL